MNLFTKSGIVFLATIVMFLLILLGFMIRSTYLDYRKIVEEKLKWEQKVKSQDTLFTTNVEIYWDEFGPEFTKFESYSGYPTVSITKYGITTIWSDSTIWAKKINSYVVPVKMISKTFKVNKK